MTVKNNLRLYREVNEELRDIAKVIISYAEDNTDLLPEWIRNNKSKYGDIIIQRKDQFTAAKYSPELVARPIDRDNFNYSITTKDYSIFMGPEIAQQVASGVINKLPVIFSSVFTLEVLK